MNLLKRAWFIYQLRRRFYTWDRAKLQRHQRARVAAILAHVRKRSPFYSDLLKEERKLEDVPIIDKSVMMANFDRINTKHLNRESLIAFKIDQERAGDLDLYDDQYSIGLSSGTSGSRGLTVLSRSERELYGCMIWARSGLPKGIGRIRLLFTLRTNNAAYMEASSPLGPEIVFADYTHTADDIVAIINDRRINVLAGPPSLLRMVSERADLIRASLKAIISYAEVLDSKTDALIKQRFQAPVIQIYQCSEGFIASTCRCGNLHLNEDTILVEVEDIRGDESPVKNAILTDLYRTTQPIIRYRLGDLLEFDPEPCHCGSCFRRIKVIHGRSDDIFYLRDELGNTRYLFPDYVRRAINQASGDIVEYQVLQHSPDEIEIRLALVPDADRPGIEAKVMENLQWRADRIGGKLGSVRFNDKLPDRNPRSQKLIRVVRNF